MKSRIQESSICIHSAIDLMEKGKGQNERTGQTWREDPQLLLNLINQISNCRRRTSPEDKTIPRIDKTRLNARVFKSLKDGIEDQSLEVWREKFGSLLGITSGPVGGIAGLDLSLGLLTEELMKSTVDDRRGLLQGHRDMLL